MRMLVTALAILVLTTAGPPVLTDNIGDKLVDPYAQEASPAAVDPIPEGTQVAVVSGHVDGDKFKVMIDGKEYEVNLIGADAPEPGECLFDASSRFLARLLPIGSTVYLERDQKDKDGKGRLLRYVWVEYQNDGQSDLINVRVIRYGFAGWISRDGNTSRDVQLEAAQTRAKETNEEIWFECGEVHADKPLMTCMMVPRATMDAIKAGFEEAFDPRVWKAVAARPHPDYPYIVAAVGPVSLMSDASDPDVAVWAVNNLDSPTKIVSADIMAGAFSNFPDGSILDPPINDSTPGVREAITCTGYVLPVDD
ncbi:MAG: thermonuclease family protein [Chloroflexota bacterium]|nr:thermonuclease family protein [Chloroflexota bacterium]